MTTIQDPFKLFSLWYEEAKADDKINDANAMNLATSSWNGVPSNRMTLLDSFNNEGFTFYSDPQSRRGEELSDNPRASLCFSWDSLKRQIRVEGNVVLVDNNKETPNGSVLYNVVPTNVEFWQQNDSESYDKIFYRLENSKWENEVVDAQNAENPLIGRSKISA